MIKFCCHLSFVICERLRLVGEPVPWIVGAPREIALLCRASPRACVVSRQRNFSSPISVKDSSITDIDLVRNDLKPSEVRLREEVGRRQALRISLNGLWKRTVTILLKHSRQFFCRNLRSPSFHPGSLAGCETQPIHQTKGRPLLAPLTIKNALSGLARRVPISVPPASSTAQPGLPMFLSG
jgi:hypothetical protein